MKKLLAVLLACIFCLAIVNVAVAIKLPAPDEVPPIEPTDVPVPEKLPPDPN